MTNFITFDQWMDGELERLDRLSDFFDREISKTKLKPVAKNYLRFFSGTIEVTEILCGQIYAVTNEDRPLGLVKAHSEVCLELKETDQLQVKLGFREKYWHFLEVYSIQYAGPDEDLANQRRKREQFLKSYPEFLN